VLKKSTGIDIDSDSIKVVELSSTGKTVSVTRFSEFPLGDRDAFTLLKELVKEKKIDFRNICTGIPAEKIFFRETFMPFVDRKKISQTVALSLADTLPIPVEDALFSYYTQENVDGKTRVTSLITRKDTLSGLEQSLLQAGLSPNVVSAENAATVRAIRPSAAAGKNYVSLHINSDKTTINFVSDKKITFTRVLKFRMNDAISRIGKQIDAGENDVRQMLFSGVSSSGRHNAENLQAIIDQAIGALAREIEVTIKSHNKAHDPVADLVVFGDGAEIKGLSALLESETGLAWAGADIDPDIQVKTGINKKDLISRGQAALGYALTGMERGEINFVQGRGRLFGNPLFASLYSQRRLLLIGAAVLLVVYAASIYADLTLERKRYDALNSQIRKMFISTLPEVTKIVNERHQLKTALDELEERASIISDEGSLKSVDILREISANIPESVIFRATRLRIGNDNVNIEAETNNFDSVEKIKNGLKKSVLFASVDVGGAKASRLQNVIEFQMKVELAK